MSKNIQTIIEITDSHVKLLESKGTNSKPTVVTIDIKPILTPTDDGVAKAILDVSRSRRVSPDQSLLVIPRRFVILKRLRLPSQHEAELRKMIGLQLVNRIPYGLEEVHYEYQVISKDTQGYTDVLVLIVNRSVTRRYVKILEQAGLKCGRIAMSSFGLAWWSNYQEHIKKNKVSTAVLLINVDFAHSEICFCQDEKLLFSRSVNYGERDLNEEGVSAFSKQVGLSYTNYQREKMGNEIKKIVIVSNLAEAGILKKQIEKELGIYVEVISPFENIDIQKRLKSSAYHSQPGMAMAVLFGFQFVDNKQIINLTPSEVHEDKQQIIRRREWALFFILLFLAFALGAGIFGVETYFKKQMLNQLKARNKELKPKLEEVERRVNFLKTFDQKIKGRIIVSTLLDKLYQMTPMDISYRSILLDERGVLTLQGYAESTGGPGVNAFQEQLVRSKDFSAVNLEFATKRRIFNMEVTDFKIIINLKK